MWEFIAALIAIFIDDRRLDSVRVDPEQQEVELRLQAWECGLEGLAKRHPQVDPADSDSDTSTAATTSVVSPHVVRRPGAGRARPRPTPPPLALRALCTATSPPVTPQTIRARERPTSVHAIGRLDTHARAHNQCSSPRWAQEQRPLSPRVEETPPITPVYSWAKESPATTQRKRHLPRARTVLMSTEPCAITPIYPWNTPDEHSLVSNVYAARTAALLD